MRRGRDSDARGAGGAAAVLLALLAVGAAPAHAGSSPTPSLRPAVITSDQGRLLSSGVLRVKVRSSANARVRVYGSSAGIVTTRIAEAKLRRKRTRVLKLRLTTAGRRVLEHCGTVRVAVTAAAVLGRDRRPAGKRRAVRSLSRDAARCRATPARPIPFDAGEASRCDPLDTGHCLFPWPSDHFTRADRATATGRRLALASASMPANRAGKRIDPAPYNRNDGFSPGQVIITRVPGLETPQAFRRTGAVPVDDMARAFDRAQPVVVVNTRTRARHLIWAELDANAERPEDVSLLIHPGVNFEEGTRYVVALRDLRGADGRPLRAPDAFRLYRDRILTTNRAIEARRPAMESIFATLADAGIERDTLYRAWDFTVASRRSLSERVLSIRDDAFARLGDRDLADLRVAGEPPPFRVTRVTENPEPELARRVEGTVTVPCYLNLPGCPSGARFAFRAGTDLPEPLPGNTTEARFQCNVPKAAVGGPPARASLYGHGLLGSRGEVNQGQLRRFGQEHNVVFCATDWVGMSCADLPDPSPDLVTNLLAGRVPKVPDCDYPNVLTILEDLSNFPTLADRVQQGLINFLYLGRAMVHPRGFNAHPAFQTGGRGVLDTTRLFYDGNSQGGIIGGALAAIAPDHERAVLGVPGMNYSLLLTRSSDWGTGKAPDSLDLPEYSWFLYEAYPDEREHPLLISLIQLLWDRAEANGYAHHMTSDPLPNTPRHEILLHVALGDHQVAQLAAEIEARTIGAAARTPWADPGRDADRSPHLGLPAIDRYPWPGSAMVLWDTGPPRQTPDGERGTGVPPNTNTPPHEGEDPHEAPRNEASARRQKSEFLRVGGALIDVCGPRPCYAGGWAGP